MRSLVRSIALGVAVAVGSGCAASAPTTDVAARPAQSRLTQEQIQASTATNVEQLIRSERPSWLSHRGAMGARPGEDPGTIEDVAALMVYVDGVHRGGLAELSQIGTFGVTLIEYFDPREATLRWGTGHPRGAIVVTTRPQP